MSAMRLMATAEVQQSAIEQASAEDVRRMRFLALLCGRMANQSSAAFDTDSNNRAALPARNRSASVGGMGPSHMDVVNDDASGVLPTSETIGTNGMPDIGKGGGVGDDAFRDCVTHSLVSP